MMYYIHSLCKADQLKKAYELTETLKKDATYNENHSYLLQNYQHIANSISRLASKRNETDNFLNYGLYQQQQQQQRGKTTTTTAAANECRTYTSEKC